MLRHEYPSLRQGLVGAWCPSLGATGYTLIDRSPFARHGTLTNMGGQVLYQNGGIRFDGSNDYVSLPSTLSAATGSPFTVSAWVWTFDLTTQLYPNFVQLFNSSGTSAFGVAVSSQTGYTGVLFGSSSAWGQFRADPTWASGRWNHVALSYSGASSTSASSFAVMVNGLPIAVTTAGAFGAQTNVATLGSGLGGSSISLYGLLDDVRVYIRALTQSEMAILATRRGIGLAPTPNRRAGFPRKFWINVGGTWKNADGYVNVGGTWKLASPSINVGGTWK